MVGHTVPGWGMGQLSQDPYTGIPSGSTQASERTPELPGRNHSGTRTKSKLATSAHSPKELTKF